MVLNRFELADEWQGIPADDSAGGWFGLVD